MSDDYTKTEEEVGMSKGMELAEISAAKNAVWSVLDDFEFEGDVDLISASGRIVDDLIRRGVLVPEWIADPGNSERPAQGYYPTSSHVQHWNGRRVTPQGWRGGTP